MGITKREYKEITLTEEERQNKIWVFLNQTPTIKWNQDGQELPLFDFNTGKEGLKLEIEYQNFKDTYNKKVHDSLTSRGDITDLASSIVSQKQVDQIVVQNDDVKTSCMAIC